MSPILRILINGTLFNLGWLACVVFRNWLSVCAAIAVIGIYLAMERSIPRALVLLSVAAMIGVAVDNAMLAEGIIVPVNAGQFAPFWMILLWPLLATTFNIAFASLQQRLILAAVLGGLAAPMSYLAAVKLGAAEFGVPTQFALLGIGFVWMILFPIGLQFTRQLMRPVYR